MGTDDVHEQALLSTAELGDFEVVRSIAAGNNGQIFEVACTIPQVGDRDTLSMGLRFESQGEGEGVANG